jgi:benzodiazapine receptor
MPAWISPRFVSLLIFGLLAAQLPQMAARPYLFIGRHEIALSLVDILALLVTIAAFAIAARPANHSASLLFIPYLLWVSCAAALNDPIWLRNAAKA